MEKLQQALHSFSNTYQAVMLRLYDYPAHDEKLETAIGLSSAAMRARRAKPGLWKLPEIERLASYFEMPTFACVHLTQLMRQLPAELAAMPFSRRRSVERLIPVKRPQVARYNQTGWPVQHLLRLYQNMTVKVKTGYGGHCHSGAV